MLPPETVKRRTYWVSELAKISGSFGADSSRLIAELESEIKTDGLAALLDHLRTCGAIPEAFGHDSTEEKLYSKYTDAVISETLSFLGLRSAVIDARADIADVQATCRAYSLVADAKAFRLSRTAKNQKDFKVQAMDGWRGTLDYALLVCPIYQLPSRRSQIYRQAISRNVCVLSYSHLAALVALASRRERRLGRQALQAILNVVAILHPTSDALDYWTGINRMLLSELSRDSDLWTTEKTASLDALTLAKEEAMTVLVAERDRLLQLSHRQALQELLRSSGIEKRIETVRQIEHGNLLGD
jgi:type II restriction enzyme